jgi:multidrug resistance efflux pump
MSGQPLEVRMAHLEGGYQQLDKRLGDLAASIDSRFAQVDARFVQVDARFAQMDLRFGQVELRLDGLGRRLDGFQWRMTSLIVVTWITTMLAILLKH